MEAAAKHLCPVTLELGGKSPVLVDRSAKISTAAGRIIAVGAEYWRLFFMTRPFPTSQSLPLPQQQLTFCAGQVLQRRANLHCARLHHRPPKQTVSFQVLKCVYVCMMGVGGFMFLQHSLTSTLVPPAAMSSSVS